MTTPNPAAVIDRPCVVWDMDEALYHSGPTPTESLSVSNAKRLLPPYSPARYRHDRDHGRRPSAAFDFGHAAHALVLGVGGTIVPIDARDWRTKAAQEARDAARAAGQIPMLAADLDEARAMADAVRTHKVAGPLFDAGRPEVSLFGVDDATGVWLRGRVDWIAATNDAEAVFVDYKTTTSADRSEFNRSVERYGYAMQAAWYLDLAAQLDDLPNVERFVFVAQEKEAPYLPNVFELDADWLAIGRALNRQAIDLFAACLASGRWPGYSDDVTVLAPPAWLRRRMLPDLDDTDTESAEENTAGTLDPSFEAMLASMAGLTPDHDDATPSASEAAGQRYVSLADAAARWSVSTTTIRRLIAAGRVTGHKLEGGRTVRVDLAEIDAQFPKINPEEYR